MKYDSKVVAFKSKRNKVFFDGELVEKHLHTKEAAALEAGELQRLNSAGLRVPKIISCDNNVIKMNFINGETLPDLIERLEKEDSIENTHVIETVAHELVIWLRDFYKAVNTEKTNQIRGDVNGRNFIFDSAFIWSVDFEEIAFGEKEQDIGRLLAFITTYDPVDTPLKKRLTSAVLAEAVKVLNITQEKIKIYMEAELGAITLRRRGLN